MLGANSVPWTYFVSQSEQVASLFGVELNGLARGAANPESLQLS
jgi:hypothetical protein